MNILKYRRVQTDEVARKVITELTSGTYPAFKKGTYTGERTLEILKDTLDRWDIVSFPKQRPVPFLIRLTIPVFFIVYLVSIILMGFKWFFTGRGYFNYKGWYIKFLQNWSNRLNLSSI